LRQLAWFSQGFYSVEEADDGSLIIRDLRFTERPAQSEQVRSFFNWRVTTDGGEPVLAPR
jgi:hypothetical protein